MIKRNLFLLKREKRMMRPISLECFCTTLSLKNRKEREPWTATAEFYIRCAPSLLSYLLFFNALWIPIWDIMVCFDLQRECSIKEIMSQLKEQRATTPSSSVHDAVVVLGGFWVTRHSLPLTLQTLVFIYFLYTQILDLLLMDPMY